MLDRFYLIVDDVRWLERFLPLGLKLVQLRLKDLPRDEVARQIHHAKALCATASCQLVINDHWSLALDAGCTHVHLGQEDLDDADLGALRQHGVRIGVSTHDHAELERALGIGADYIALGPIYPTLLKAMRFAPQGLERLSDWKARIGAVPLVAIGGFTPERAAGAFSAGADSICVVTDVLRASDPEQRLLEWVDVCG